MQPRRQQLEPYNTGVAVGGVAAAPYLKLKKLRTPTSQLPSAIHGWLVGFY
jgi:hypothetical protein